MDSTNVNVVNIYSKINANSSNSENNTGCSVELLELGFCTPREVVDQSPVRDRVPAGVSTKEVNLRSPSKLLQAVTRIYDIARCFEICDKVIFQMA